VSVLEASFGRFALAAIVHLIEWILANLGSWVASAPTLVPTASTLLGPYERVGVVGDALLLPALLVGAIGSLHRGSVGEVAALALRVPVWVLAVVAAPTVVADAERWVGAVSASAYAAFGAVPHAALALPPSVLAPGARSVAAVVLAVAAALAALLCFLEAVCRGVAIDVLVVLWPLAALGFVLPSLRPLLRRSVEGVVGLLFLEIAMATTLGLGAAIARAASSQADGLALLGAALVLAAGLAPALTFSLLPAAEVRIYDATRALRQAASHHARSTVDVGRAVVSELVPSPEAGTRLPPFRG
jgi:hypothetical protein